MELLVCNYRNALPECSSCCWMFLSVAVSVACNNWSQCAPVTTAHCFLTLCRPCIKCAPVQLIFFFWQTTLLWLPCQMNIVCCFYSLCYRTLSTMLTLFSKFIDPRSVHREAEMKQMMLQVSLYPVLGVTLPMLTAVFCFVLFIHFYLLVCWLMCCVCTTYLL